MALALDGPAWLLALVALSGALSVEVVESGPFTTLEQVMLAATDAPQAQITHGFGLYNAVATLAGAAAALLALWRLFRPVRLPANATTTTGGAP